MITEQELEIIAEQIGVQVRTDTLGALSPLDSGGYFHKNHLILLRPNLGAVNRLCVLAHELGHALHGDEPTGNAHFDTRAEQTADRFAARLLISPAEYAAAEALYGSHTGALARELGVTVHLVDVWKTDFVSERALP